MSFVGVKKNFYKFIFNIAELKTGTNKYKSLFESLLHYAEGSYSSEVLAKWFDMKLMKIFSDIDEYQKQKVVFSDILYLIATAQVMALDGKQYQKMLKNYQTFLAKVWHDFNYECKIQEWDDDTKKYDYIYNNI
jgi:hypothetical protein